MLRKLKRPVVYLSLGLLTAVLGVYAFYWLSPHLSPTDEVESPPCRSCSEVYAASPSDIPSVSLCDLERAPKDYDGRVIRVSALVKHDSGYFGLGDGKLCPSEKFIEAELSSSTQACDGLKERFGHLLGYKHTCWRHPFGFDGNVRATVVGRFVNDESIETDSGNGHLRLTLLCIERVDDGDAPGH